MINLMLFLFYRPKLMLPVPVPELSGDILKVVASHVTVKYRWELLRGYKTGSLISFSRPGKSWNFSVGHE